MAREMLERVTQMAPGYADAYAELADIYFQRATFGWSEFAQQDVETAIRLSQKALEIDPDCVLAHSVLARAYTSVLKYDLGLAEFGARAAAQSQRRRGPGGARRRAAVDRPHRRIDRDRRAATRLNVSIGPGSRRSISASPICWPAATATPCKLLEAPRTRYPSYPLLELPLAAAYAELGRARTPRMRSNRPSSRTRTSTSQASARASRTRRLQRRVEESLRKAGVITSFGFLSPCGGEAR